MEGTHTIRIGSLINQSVLPIMERDIGNRDFRIGHQTHIGRGKHHIAVFVIPQESDIRHTPDGFLESIGADHMDTGNHDALRGNGIIQHGIRLFRFRLHILQAPHDHDCQAVLKLQTGQYHGRMVGFIDPLAVHRQESHPDKDPVAPQLCSRNGFMGNKFHLPQFIHTDHTQTGLREVNRLTVTVGVAQLYPVHFHRLLRQGAVDHIFPIGNGRALSQHRGIDPVVFLAGHFRKHLNIASAYRILVLIFRRVLVHLLFQHHISLGIQDGVTHPALVKGIRGGTVVGIRQLSIAPAQFHGCVPQADGLGLALREDLHVFIIGFFKGAVIQAGLRHGDDTHTTGHGSQQGRSTQENREKFQNNAVLHGYFPPSIL